MNYEHYPLDKHEVAFKASIAVECARRQGKFKIFHQLLFANQDRLDILQYERLAQKANIGDRASFLNCIKSRQTKSIVRSGRTLAGKLGIDGIPAFIINDKLVTGAISKQRLEGLVEEALE